MQLINAIVITPEDLEFRVHLRNEFMRDGLHSILEVRSFYLCWWQHDDNDSDDASCRP